MTAKDLREKLFDGGYPIWSGDGAALIVEVLRPDLPAPEKAAAISAIEDWAKTMADNAADAAIPTHV